MALAKPFWPCCKRSEKASRLSRTLWPCSSPGRPECSCEPILSHGTNLGQALLADTLNVSSCYCFTSINIRNFSMTWRAVQLACRIWMTGAGLMRSKKTWFSNLVFANGKPHRGYVFRFTKSSSKNLVSIERLVYNWEITRGPKSELSHIPITR